MRKTVDMMHISFLWPSKTSTHFSNLNKLLICNLVQTPIISKSKLVLPQEKLAQGVRK